MRKFIMAYICFLLLMTMCVAITGTEKQEMYFKTFNPSTEVMSKTLETFFGIEANLEPKKEVLEEKEEIVYDGVVYLTFDDGPVAEVTPKILDILKKYDVKATFFTIGSYGIKNPEILKREIDEGHTVGNHSYSHKRSMFSSLSSFKNEIERTSKVIEDATGVKPTCFRIPYGTKVGSEYKNYLTEEGYSIVSWNCESYDSRTTTKTGEDLLKGVKNTSKGKKEVIVIMHDTYGKQKTVDALPDIIEYFKELNYEFKKI